MEKKEIEDDKDSYLMTIYDLLNVSSTVFQNNLDCTLTHRPVLDTACKQDDLKTEFQKLGYLVNDTPLAQHTHLQL